MHVYPLRISSGFIHQQGENQFLNVECLFVSKCGRVFVHFPYEDMSVIISIKVFFMYTWEKVKCYLNSSYVRYF